MKKASNQQRFVLNHLIDHGYITDAIADQYRIRRLAARVFDLRNADVQIYSQLRHDDLGQRYTNYYMTELERAVQRGLRCVRDRMSAVQPGIPVDLAA